MKAPRQLFRTGQTMGVFYTESPASRLLCAKSQADTFELLVLNTSMIRPASNKYIRLYLDRLRNGAPYEPLDPSLQDTLTESFGIMVYQEDVVNVCATFAGMPPATGDGLRKALSKKRPAKHLAAYAEEFFTGAMRLGRNPDAAKQVWEMIMSFAGTASARDTRAPTSRWPSTPARSGPTTRRSSWRRCCPMAAGFYHAFAYVAEAIRMGLTDPAAGCQRQRLPLHRQGAGAPDRIAVREGAVGGWSGAGVRGKAAGSGTAGSHTTRSRATATARCLAARFSSLSRLPRPHRNRPVRPPPADQGRRARFDRRWLDPADDALAGGCGGAAGQRDSADQQPSDGTAGSTHRSAPTGSDFPSVPTQEYSPERRRQEEYETLGFITDAHPMQLHADRLRRFRLCHSTELHQHVGRARPGCRHAHHGQAGPHHHRTSRWSSRPSMMATG